LRNAFTGDPLGKDPQPFEKNRRFDYVSDIVTELKKSPEAGKPGHQTQTESRSFRPFPKEEQTDISESNASFASERAEAEPDSRERGSSDAFVNTANTTRFKMIGQVFETYWIIEFNNEMYLIDQHAAHEKVNYERFTRLIRDHSVSSQMLFPPRVLTLSAKEAALMEKNLGAFEEAGYEIEPAGDRDYVVRAIPSNLPAIGEEELLMDLIQSMSEETRGISSEDMKYRIASMSCKAAVKGNRPLSEPEMRALIGELLTLDNPYMCPHGRPTIARWTKAEIDRIFKRIV
ncbi:MAG: DNA mismatch repair protein MutL, partial [Lachnospiraceae bacterium]|nr:DNA mismatch repair protein MutL [Lachnospiraceae bacterium]